MKPHFHHSVLLCILTMNSLLSMGQTAAPAAEDDPALLSFFREHPNQVSLVFQVEGELFADQQPDRLLPLASTMKLLLLAGCSRLADEGLLDPEEPVSIQELDRFYLAGTDGGAHDAWKSELAVQRDAPSATIPLKDVLRGMILYSSNANTEFVMRRLGRERLEGLPQSLGLTEHTALYPIVGALMISRFMDGPPNNLPSKLRALDAKSYADLAWACSDSLAGTSGGKLRESFRNPGLAVQKVWSEKLPASTAAAYVSLAEQLNDRSGLGEKGIALLRYTAEALMESSGNQALFQHAGMKGGSTGFTLTKCAYATTKDGASFELAYLITDLNPFQVQTLAAKMNEWEAALLTDADARQKLAALFAPDGE